MVAVVGAEIAFDLDPNVRVEGIAGPPAEYGAAAAARRAQPRRRVVLNRDGRLEAVARIPGDIGPGGWLIPAVRLRLRRPGGQRHRRHARDGGCGRKQHYSHYKPLQFRRGLRGQAHRTPAREGETSPFAAVAGQPRQGADVPSVRANLGHVWRAYYRGADAFAGQRRSSTLSPRAPAAPCSST